MPAGVVVDRFGTITVSDRVNHALYLYDASYRLFRTLGHPADAGSADGYLNQPVALAQHPQDGSGYAGNVFIADMNNGRVQRWDVGGGYTYWVRALSPPRVDPTDPIRTRTRPTPIPTRTRTAPRSTRSPRRSPPPPAVARCSARPAPGPAVLRPTATSGCATAPASPG